MRRIGQAAARGFAGAVLTNACRFGIVLPCGKKRDPQSFRVRCHVAVPFGGSEHEAETDGIRPSRSDELRVAFNSPFRPFLLATTSVGQEGLDFHPWCSQIAHWGSCSSPLDLEQREGRVQRYLGLAGRRQLAVRHGAAALTLGRGMQRPVSPWEHILRCAESEASDDGGLSPWWVAQKCIFRATCSLCSSVAIISATNGSACCELCTAWHLGGPIRKTCWTL